MKAFFFSSKDQKAVLTIIAKSLNDAVRDITEKYGDDWICKGSLSFWEGNTAMTYID